MRRFIAGPLTVEQFGNTVFTQTNWDPDDFEKNRQYLKLQRPQLKTEIDAKVRQIETIVGATTSCHFFVKLAVTQSAAGKELPSLAKLPS